MLEKLMESPISWAALSLLAIFSTLFSIYTWIVGNKFKQFSVSCKTNEIITCGQAKINKLNIKYDGCDISDLSSSKFYIWNSGNVVIKYADIVTSRPLCIKNTGNAQILDVQIVCQSDESNNFSVAVVKDGLVQIAFDYIDHGEGVVLQILHTGLANDLELDCKIIGGKEVIDRSVIKRKKEEPRSQVLVDTLCAALPAILSFGSLFVSANLADMVQAMLDVAAWIEALISNLIIIAAWIIGLFIGIKIPKGINKRFHRTIPASLLK